MQSNDSYNTGLHDELSLIRRLAPHHAVTASTREENLLQDIDCYIDGVPVSIKTQNTAAKTGNLAFELRFCWRATGEWVDSWFYYGLADYYLVQVYDKVYRLDCKPLKAWVAGRGWDRETTNTGRSREQQGNLGHPQSDFKIGLVKIQTLIDNNLAEELTYVSGSRGNTPRINRGSL